MGKRVRGWAGLVGDDEQRLKSLGGAVKLPT